MPIGRVDRGALTGRRAGNAVANLRPFPETITEVKTATYTARYGELVRADPTGGGFTVNLPTAYSVTGRIIGIKNASASTNTITIDGSGAETIDGAATATITVAQVSLILVSDGSNWIII